MFYEQWRGFLLVGGLLVLDGCFSIGEDYSC